MSDRAVYADVAASIAVVAVAVVAVLNLEPITARAVLAGALVLFFPGYALTTLVFPATREMRPKVNGFSSAFAGRTEHAGLPFPERLAVSFGLSAALVPLFAWTLQVWPARSSSRPTSPPSAAGPPCSDSSRGAPAASARRSTRAT